MSTTNRFILLVATLSLVIIIATSIAVADIKKKNDSIFKATKDWQVVKKGVALPPGLHIRHNLQTGETEAKLLDENEVDKKPDENVNDSKTNSLTLHPEHSTTTEEEEGIISNMEDPNNRLKIPLDELKEMLKKIKSDEATAKTGEQPKPERRKKFRSYTELKEEFEAMNMNISTDSEVLTGLFNQFESYKESISTENLESSKIEDILEILNNMEYLIHQIDNAQIFADMGGMSKIISPSLNSTNSEVKAEALKLLGAAVQLNPRVQLKALENDFVQKLLHMLTINNKIEVKSRCLFALGALVRHFPAAQKALVNNGGLEIFGKILADGHFQIQTRIMNLINDLTIERENLRLIEDDQQRFLRSREYDLTNFEQKLLMQKYCQNLVDLTIRSLKTNSEIDDFHEAIYQSTVTVSSICKSELIDKQDILLSEIEKRLTNYRDSPKIENDDNLNSHYQELLEKLRNSISTPIHDEL